MGLKEGLAEAGITVNSSVEDHGMCSNCGGGRLYGLPSLSWTHSQGSQGTGVLASISRMENVLLNPIGQNAIDCSLETD